MASPDRWIATWTATPAPPPQAPAEFDDQTLRLMVRTSAAGRDVRVRISNTYGEEPLVIGRATLARRATGAAVEPGTNRALTFGGDQGVTVPAGSVATSDAAGLRVRARTGLAVSLYLPGRTLATTDHVLALRTSYATPTGDHSSAIDLPDPIAITTLPFLTGVDVRTGSGTTTVVCFGDSITDGADSSPDANRRWPDLLADRLHARLDADVSVLNQGLIGNRLLFPGPAWMPFPDVAGVDRFDRDVMDQAGVTHVVLQFGVNDIGFAGSVAPAGDHVSAADLVTGFRRLVERAHDRNVRVIGATIGPFQDATAAPGFHTPVKEAVREAVNSWIRHGGELDGVIDLDLVLRDPGCPARLRTELDSGDHLHPNDAGHRAIADAIDLGLFRSTR
jgi:lysophospholipase L1-like esterase